MAKAKRVRSTPRRTASKSDQIEATSTRSKIIEQAVIYARALAAYHAGFEVDPTGDSDYASKLEDIEPARKAMEKLNSISPRKGPGEPEGCLSAEELQAKAKVLGVLYGLKDCEEPDETEKEFIRLFAGEVLDFIAEHRVVVI
jgi:hypothetical protein